MDWQTFKEVLTTIKEPRYILIDEVCFKGDDCVLIGSISADNPLGHSNIFNAHVNGLSTILDLVNTGSVNNFIDKGEVSLSKFPVFQDVNLNTSYSVVNTSKIKENSFFDLFNLLLADDCYIKVPGEDYVISCNNVEFARDKYTLSCRYPTESGMRTFRILYFTHIMKLSKFTFYSKDSGTLFDSIQEYIKLGLVEDLGNGDFSIEPDKLSILPIDLSSLQQTFSKSLFLTIFSELNAYDSYFEGIDLTSKLIRNYFEIPTSSGVDPSSRPSVDKQIRNFKLVYPRQCYTNKIFSENIVLGLGVIDDYYSNDNTDSYKKLLQRHLYGKRSSLTIEGALFTLSLLQGNYHDTSALITKYKKELRIKTIYKNLYYYYWRGIFLEYPHLVRGYLKPDEDMVLTGGAYKDTVTYAT